MLYTVVGHGKIFYNIHHVMLQYVGKKIMYSWKVTTVKRSLKATKERNLKGFIARCTSHCMQMKTDICNEVICSLCPRTFKLDLEVGRKVRDHLCTDHPSKSTHVQYDGSRSTNCILSFLQTAPTDMKSCLWQEGVSEL